MSRDEKTGVCSECQSGPEAYHRRTCTHFNGYHCHNCGRMYHGEYCSACPVPWWVEELS